MTKNLCHIMDYLDWCAEAWADILRHVCVHQCADVCLIIKCRLTWQGSQRALCPLLPVCTDISAASDNKVWFSQPPFWCDAIVVWANSRGPCRGASSAIWSVAPQLWLQCRNFHSGEDASLWTLAATCARQKVRSKQSSPWPAHVSPCFSSHILFGCSR